MSRLLDQMRDQSARLQSQSAGYRYAGEGFLAASAREAAYRIDAAIAAIEAHEVNTKDATA